MSELLHTALLLLGQGWRDQDDADALRHDAVFRLAVSERRGIGPLQTRPHEDGTPLVKNPPVPDGLASQPTLSRLVGMLSLQKNREGLRGALLECAVRRLHAMRGIDIDSLPIEVHGHQPGSAYNGHYHTRIFHPLIASIAETGDRSMPRCAPAMRTRRRAGWSSSARCSTRSSASSARWPPCAWTPAFPRRRRPVP